MLEIGRASIFGFNLVPTVLLILVLLYWALTMVGALDMDAFDLDFDVDADGDIGDVGGNGEGPFHSVFTFLNLNDVPLMLFLSVVFLSMWTIAVSSKVAFDTSSFMSGVLLIPNALISILITKFITWPFKGFFRALKTTDEGVKVLGQTCTLLCDLEPGYLGQAEIANEGAPVRISVIARQDTRFQKGDSAIVLERNKDRDVYVISPFTE